MHIHVGVVVASLLLASRVGTASADRSPAPVVVGGRVPFGAVEGCRDRPEPKPRAGWPVGHERTRARPEVPIADTLSADLDGDIVGRNTFYGDATRNLDLGIFKTFALPKGRLMARLELFNAFNSPQFAFPTSDFANANFGRILGTATAYQPRQIQATFRYIF